MARGCRISAVPDPSVWPGVTVLIPAYRERKVIAGKVDDVLRNGYPGPLEVLVVADDPETAQAAAGTPARVLGSGRRRGKAGALNEGVRAARHPVVVLNDANTTLAPGAIGALVRHFEDPAVGAVAGEKRVTGDDGQGLYWRFESWLKRKESVCGTTIGLVGEICGIRRSQYRLIPADISVDDLWLALDVTERGARIPYEPLALASEDPSPRRRDEWERRTRIVAGALDVIWRRRDVLSPRYGLLSAQLWGHRLVRSSFGPLAHLGLLVAALRQLKVSPPAVAFVWGHVVALAAILREDRGGRLTKPERVAAQILFLQAVGLGGVWRYLSGDRPALWTKLDRNG